MSKFHGNKGDEHQGSSSDDDDDRYSRPHQRSTTLHLNVGD
jgi:hypothetical protein